MAVAEEPTRRSWAPTLLAWAVIGAIVTGFGCWVLFAGNDGQYVEIDEARRDQALKELSELGAVVPASAWHFHWPVDVNLGAQWKGGNDGLEYLHPLASPETA